MEETIEKINALTEESVSSIENWMDIIPDANVKTQIGQISDLSDELISKTNELDNLKNQLDKVVVDRNEKLKKEIADENYELLKLKSRFIQKQYEFGLSDQSIGTIIQSATNPAVKSVTVRVDKPIADHNKNTDLAKERLESVKDAMKNDK